MRKLQIGNIWRVRIVFIALAMALPVLAQEVRTELGSLELKPLTHAVYIPAGVDLASMTLENAKAGKAFTRAETRPSADGCEPLPYREPGGSLYCPSTEQTSSADAFVLTYSYASQSSGSDENGNRKNMFQIYFRPEELPRALGDALSAGKLKSAELTAYFHVSTSRPLVRKAVIDTAKSSFCSGNYRDGAWAQDDAGCRDRVKIQAAAVPSDYIIVQVDPVVPAAKTAVANAGK